MTCFEGQRALAAGVDDRDPPVVDVAERRGILGIGEGSRMESFVRSSVALSTDLVGESQ